MHIGFASPQNLINLTPLPVREVTVTMSPLRLFIAPTSPAFAHIYRSAADSYNITPYHERNSGFDMFCDAHHVRQEDGVNFVEQGCRALAIDEHGRSRAFWLAPRSSMSKSHWRLANSMGLIDATYRGPIIAALDSRNPLITLLCHSHHEKRLCQLAAPDLLPWAEVVVVDTLPGPATSRGSGGFGSTG
jgi:dUTP pyrophosphatase